MSDAHSEIISEIVGLCVCVCLFWEKLTHKRQLRFSVKRRSDDIKFTTP